MVYSNAKYEYAFVNICKPNNSELVFCNDKNIEQVCL